MHGLICRLLKAKNQESHCHMHVSHGYNLITELFDQQFTNLIVHFFYLINISIKPRPLNV